MLHGFHMYISTCVLANWKYVHSYLIPEFKIRNQKYGRGQTVEYHCKVFGCKQNCVATFYNDYSSGMYVH